MGELKKIKTLIDSYERLPDDNFKKSIKRDLEQIKEIYAEVHSLKKMRDRLDANVDDCMITYVDNKGDKDDTH